MKTKQSILALLTFAAFLVPTSCSDSPVASNSDSILKNIPSLYEAAQVDFAKKAKGMNPDEEKEKAEKMISEFTKEIKGIDRKAQHIANDQIGKKINFTQSENLPYKIASDVKIDEIILPQVSILGSNKPAQLLLGYDLVITDRESKSHAAYFFLTDGKEPIDADIHFYSREAEKHDAPNDTLHIITKIRMNEIPAKYLEKITSVEFVSKDTYDAKAKELRDKHTQWDEQKQKDLGLK